MPSFKRKQLEQAKRVCLRLREAREATHTSLDEVARRTKISAKHIHAIEDCRFEDIPFASIYKKNFIRRYAEAIGANPDTFVRQFVSEESVPHTRVEHPKTKVRLPLLSHLPTFLHFGGAALILMVIVGYLGWQVHQIVKPPQLHLYTPENGLITQEPSISVRGLSDPGTTISINGQPIPNKHDSGQFETVVPLAQGINPITVLATKKHGKTSSVTRYVIVRDGHRLSRR